MHKSQVFFFATFLTFVFPLDDIFVYVFIVSETMRLYLPFSKLQENINAVKITDGFPEAEESTILYEKFYCMKILSSSIF